MFETIQNIMARIKQERPLLLNITNYVSMDFVANGLLSLGASPVMSKAPQELEDLIEISQAVVINLGTLNTDFVELSEQACQIANDMKKPIILDPVGAGASRYRTTVCERFIHDFDIAIIRGNASEILALAGSEAATKGVDSSAESNSAIDSAKALSEKHKLTVFVSGKTDYVIDGERFGQCDRGSVWMPLITGTGCLLSAVVAAFHSVHADRFEAALAAAEFFALRGELAAQKSRGPGTFKAEFLDALNEAFGSQIVEKP